MTPLGNLSRQVAGVNFDARMPVSQRSIVVIHTEIWISPMLHHVVCQGKALVSPSGEVDWGTDIGPWCRADVCVALGCCSA